MPDEIIAPVETTPPAEVKTETPIVVDVTNKAVDPPIAEAKIDEKKVDETVSWDEGWREKIAGQDEKTLKRLERFTSVKAVADALLASQDKIRSGEVKFPLKAGSSPEEIATWRKDNGIPEKYQEYDVGIVEPALKTFAENFLKAAHEQNFSTDKARAVVDFIAAERARSIEEHRLKDEENAGNTEEVLRSEWGSDYKPNFNAISNMFAKHGDNNLEANLLGGRMSDGTIIGDSPAALKMLAGLARELNPYATIVPGSGQNQINSANNRIQEIEAMMTDDNSPYNKPSTMIAVRTEYQNLVNARLKMKG